MSALRIAVITDVHAAPEGSPAGSWQAPFEPSDGAGLVHSAIEALRDHAVDVAFVLGDVANEGDDTSFDTVLAELRHLDVPTYLVAGNHDLRIHADALQQAIARDGGRSMHIPKLEGEVVHNDMIVAGLHFEGETDEVVSLVQSPSLGDWRDRAVLLLSHYPILSRIVETGAAGWKYAGDPKGLTNLVDQLASRQSPAISFHGHLHLADAVARGSYLQLGFPALIETGHAISLVEVSHAGSAINVEITLIHARDDSGSVAAIGTPARSWAFKDGRWSS